MPLPKISTSQHELTLPSTGKKIKFRPFLVREEKILILALESQNQKQISNAVKQVLKDCILTRGIKVDTLPSFDIEYIFLNVRQIYNPLLMQDEYHLAEHRFENQ